MKPLAKISMRSTILLMSVLTILPLLAIFFYFQFVLAKDVRRDAFNNTTRFAQQLSQEMERQFSFLNSTATFMLTNTSLQSAMDSFQPLSHSVLNGTEIYLRNNSAGGYGSKENLIHNIFLFRSEDDYAAIGLDYFVPAAYHRSLSVYQVEGDPSHPVTIITSPEQDDYLYYVFNYADLNTRKDFGKVVVELNPKPLLSSTYLDSIYPGSYVYLYSGEGTVYLSNDPAHEDEVPAYLAAIEEQGNFSTVTIGRENYFGMTQLIKNHRYQLLLLTPQQEVLSTLYEIMRVFYPLAILITLCNLALAFLLSRRLTGALKDMITRLDQFVASGFTARMPSYRYMEIDIVSKSFNGMAGEIEQLVTEGYENKLLQQEMELELLYSQINPHFLYNVLDVIHWDCLRDGADRAAGNINALSGLLRNSVQSRNKDKVPLRDEMQYVQLYLQLQQARFQDRLEFSVAVENDTLMELMIPRMLIQPLVENSFVHGIEKIPGKGVISVHIWEEENGLCIRVEDNGAGFPEAGGTHVSSGSGVALKNIRSRLQLLYQDNYEMTISNRPQGASVFICIPFSKGQGGSCEAPQGE